MLFPIKTGHELDSVKPIHLDPKSFPTHHHLFGVSGPGKATAIRAILNELLAHDNDSLKLQSEDAIGNSR